MGCEGKGKKQETGGPRTEDVGRSETRGTVDQSSSQVVTLCDRPLTFRPPPLFQPIQRKDVVRYRDRHRHESTNVENVPSERRY